MVDRLLRTAWRSSAAFAADRLAGKLIRFPFRAVSRGSSMRILAGPLKGKGWIPSSTNLSCWFGFYEFDKVELCCRLVGGDGVFFDLGAHVGYFTILAAQLVGPGGQVWAFEPLPRNVGFLREHLRLNGITNATVVEAGVADFSGTAPFDNSLGGVACRLSHQGTARVRVLSIDALVSGSEVPEPDYLKIDVEGAELSVLRGAHSTLVRARPTIFIDTHGPMIHRECVSFLRGLGYHLESLRERPIELSSEFVAWHPSGAEQNRQLKAFFGKRKDTCIERATQ